jgi:predicted house-cleaning noncanonical NTP pyrophosphatase (MazG superfamily)
LNRSKVIDTLRLKQQPIAYFYCYYKEESRIDPASVLRALVKQICLMSPSGTLPEPVVSVYQKREKAGHVLGPLHQEESRDLIVLLLASYKHEQTTIVIDALDECRAEDRRQLFHSLKHIVTSVYNTKLFIASRNERDIQILLNKSLDHYIDAKDNTTDINNYIRSEVERCFEDGSLPEVEDLMELKSDIVSALEKGANGMYELASMLLFMAIC